MQLATVDMQSTITSAPARPSPAVGASAESGITSLLATSSSTNVVSSTATPSTSSTSAVKGMQLGKGKTPASVASAALAAQLAEEVAMTEPDGNPWGTDDLIDINADQDDWSS